MNIKLNIRFLLILYFVGLFHSAIAQKSISFTNSLHNGFQVVEQTSDNFQASLSFKTINLNDFNANNANFTEVSIDGFGKSYIPGYPDLPIKVQVISVPVNVNISISDINFDIETVDLKEQGITTFIKPGIQSISKSDNPNTIKYELGSAYTSNKFTSSPVLELKQVGVMRNLKLYELVYQPVLYNAVQQKIKVRNNVSFQITWNSKVFDAEKWNFTEQHNLPLTKTTSIKGLNVNETFVIVSPKKYEETLQPFVMWKKQKGFNVIESYIGEDIATNDKNAIKTYLKNLYENPEEGVLAPSYLLIIGDVIDIPAWGGTTDSHVTDLYYAEYTGDFLPELYYGRFSVATTEQLQTIIDKTLYVEKGSGADFSYQNNHLLISGVDKDFAPIYGNGAINYFLKYYSLEDFGITPSYYLYGSGSPITSNNSQAKQAILDDFTAGTGIAYYTAHCSTYGWSNPEFEINDISGISNKDKYPLMIGNCCESLKFNLTSFGEEIVRTKDKGAVAYIGATNYSYWDEDYYWGIGFTTNIVGDPDFEKTELGAFDAWFHTHDEVEENRAYTVGQILNVGNLAVQSSSSTLKNYYWEIYQIMGDPSLVPAKYQTEVISATYSSIFTVGMSSLTVETEQNAIVSLMENGELLAVSAANSEGICNLSFMPLQNIGENQIEMVVSLPDYSPLIISINVIAPNGPYLVLQGIEIDDSEGNGDGNVDFGETISINLIVENFGSESATNTKAVLNSASNWVMQKIDNRELLIGTIIKGERIVTENQLTFTLKENVPNREVILINGTLFFDENQTKDFEFEVVVNAPAIEVSNWLVDATGIGNLNGIIEPDESVSIDVFFTNTGTAQVSNTVISFESTNNDLITILSESQAAGGFEVGDTTRVEVQVMAGSDIFPGAQFNLNYQVLAGDNSQYNYTGTIPLILGDLPEYNMDNDSIEIISGYFYDSGGPDGKYSNNESSIMTFVPYNANEGIMIDFIDFNIEPSATGCYDKLYIYDGLTIESPLIGTFCNNNFKSKIQSQNSDGALTFKFTSDTGVTKDGWKGFISSANRHKLTLKITDGIDWVDSAYVEFGNASDTTNLNGIVEFRNILSALDKQYTISKEGFFDYSGTLGTINSDTSITILIQKLPDICITVVDGISPLEGATVSFDGRTLQTDENGYANFIDVIPGSKTFRVKHDKYIDTTGIIVVGSIDVCYNIKLTKIPTYELGFVVIDEFGFVKDAKIEIDSSIEYSDEYGKAIFSELPGASYYYSVAKDGYHSVSENTVLMDSNVIEQVEIKHITYSVQFNVAHNEDMLASAMVIIGNDTLITSGLGEIVFEDVIPDSAIQFTIVKDGYNQYSSTFDLIDQDIVLNINMIPVGIYDKQTNILQIYPNPIKEDKKLNIKSNSNIEELRVFNFMGEVLISKNNLPKEFDINMSEFNSGIYILQIKIGEELFFRKVIVK